MSYRVIIPTTAVTTVTTTIVTSHQIITTTTTGTTTTSYRVITATSVSDAEPDVALVVDGGGVRELVSLEVDQGGRLAHAVLELAHDLTINWTSEMEKQDFM